MFLINDYYTFLLSNVSYSLVTGNTTTLQSHDSVYACIGIYIHTDTTYTLNIYV